METICGIANSGPYLDGYLYFGVCDTELDAKRVALLDKISPFKLDNRYIVGIDREAMVLEKSVEDYIRILSKSIQESPLSEPLKTQSLANFEALCQLLGWSKKQKDNKSCFDGHRAYSMTVSHFPYGFVRTTTLERNINTKKGAQKELKALVYML